MASRGINKVILIGNLGQDPEMRYTSDDTPIANLSLATSETWKNAQGQQQEKTEWHKVSIFGKTAEIAGEYLRKGSQVYIEGKLETRKWQNQNGQDQYTTSVVVQGFAGKMQMLGGYGQGQNQPAQQQSGANSYAQAKSGNNGFQPAQQPPDPQAEPAMDFDDDIPF